MADAEVGVGDVRGGVSLDLGVEDLTWGAAADSAMRAVVVVVGDEPVDLSLEFDEVDGGVLFGEIALEGLMEAFDLAAGLGVIGPGVLVGHAEGLEEGFHHHFPAPMFGGVDAAVVGEHRRGCPVALRGAEEHLSDVGGPSDRNGNGRDTEAGWSSRKLTISTWRSSAMEKCVMSDCQVSLGRSALKCPASVAHGLGIARRLRDPAAGFEYPVIDVEVSVA